MRGKEKEGRDMDRKRSPSSFQKSRGVLKQLLVRTRSTLLILHVKSIRHPVIISEKSFCVILAEQVCACKEGPGHLRETVRLRRAQRLIGQFQQLLRALQCLGTSAQLTLRKQTNTCSQAQHSRTIPQVDTLLYNNTVVLHCLWRYLHHLRVMAMS